MKFKPNMGPQLKSTLKEAQTNLNSNSFNLYYKKIYKFKVMLNPSPFMLYPLFFVLIKIKTYTWKMVNEHKR